jgi:PAS domain S-box-containing protein
MNEIRQCDASRSSQGRCSAPINAPAECAIYTLDLLGFITSCNRAAERLWRCQATEILGQHFSESYTAEDRQWDTPRVALETSHREGGFSSDGWQIRKDGSRFWAHILIDPIYATEGVLAGFVQITHEFTEREPAMDISGKSEQQLQWLVQEAVDYAICLLDVNGLVASWNFGAQRMMGYRADQIIGTNFARFYNAEDQEKGRPKAALEMAALVGRFEHESWRVRKDNSCFWANIVINAIRGTDGTVIGFAEVCRDSTERRAADISLAKTREASCQSQKMEVIGKLAAGIAHDFNNILQGIVAGLELYWDEVGENTPAQEFAGLALNSAKRGAMLTHQLLSYARKQCVPSQAIALLPFLCALKDLLSRTLGNHITVNVSVDGNLAVMADPGQLQTALINLAINGSQAMVNGGTLNMLASRATEGERRWVILTVTDTGIGMDAATLAQSSDSCSVTNGAVDTGLSMVRSFANESGGRFCITSVLGRGTSAELHLPAVSARKERVGPLLTAWPPVCGRILVVDDSMDVLVATSAFLEKAGFDVVRAASGDEALLLLAGGDRFDALVTDFAMPGLNGADLIAEGRLMQPGLRALIITGYAGIGHAHVFPDETLILQTPFQREDLLNALRQVIGNNQIEITGAVANPQIGNRPCR